MFEFLVTIFAFTAFSTFASSHLVARAILGGINLAILLVLFSVFSALV
jgi:hypothetical protein